ncbi:MAG: META domain-containing protein [Alphaproteobacteria bacterium]|nr:META domain-containing protein [Alphaproteobacteria bacterium]
MRAALIILSFAVALASCTANEPVGHHPLAGTQWVLKAMAGWDSATAPQVPTIFFQSETSVGGRSGCNSWGGGYELKGTQIRFSRMRSTLMACAYGMEFERLYVDMIEKTHTIRLNGDVLILADESGTERAQFFRASTAVPPSR